MKSKSVNKTGVLIMVGILVFLFVPVIDAQQKIPVKGYGDAVYNGMQDNIFMTRWMLLGPLPVADKKGEFPDRETMKKAFDTDMLTSVLVDEEKTISPLKYDGRKYEWNYTASAGETVKLNELLGDTNYVICYALAKIVVEEPVKVLVGLGSDDGVKMWLNGREVHRNYIDRAVVVDDDIFEIYLEKGDNQLLIKILNAQYDYGFAFRSISGSAVSDLLLRSAETGDFDNVKTLVNYSPDYSKTDKTGLNAWQLATIKGRADIAQYLEEKGALTSEDFPPLDNYIDDLLLSVIKREKAPGAAVLVSENGKILFKEGYGLADIGYNIPVSTVTKFRIGSITKQFIAAAILKLQEEGKIIVSEKLSKFIPDFPRGDEVTVHHLLTHTSGIHSFTNRPDFLKTAAAETNSKEMIDLIKTEKYDFNPGDNFRYNNSGYFILGFIIEKVTGKSYGDYLKEAFFDPLGMKNTGVHASNLILENEATGYTMNNNKFEKALNWDMSRAGGAGSLYSTVEDLFLWNEAVFTGKVLNNESRKAAFTIVTLNNGKKPEEMNYGYGWVMTNIRGMDFILHGGGLQGFLSQLVRQPENKITIVVLTNCTPAQDGKSPDQIANSIAEYMLWPKMSRQQSYSTDSSVYKEDLKKYEGRYDYGNAMVLTVVSEDSALYAQMTGQARFEIFPRGNDEFYWKVVEARIKFRRNDEGEITGAIHYQGGRELNVNKLPEIRTIILDSAVLDKYTGNYEYQSDVIITITAGDGKLFARPGGQNKVELFPVSETEFVAKEMNANLRFIPVEDNGYDIWIRVGADERTIKKVTSDE
ncbi:MAG: serine hydrolase [Bacteroidales bacterium]|nr:serine hydrolase [Bacteroidales bacterium]